MSYQSPPPKKKQFHSPHGLISQLQKQTQQKKTVFNLVKGKHAQLNETSEHSSNHTGLFSAQPPKSPAECSESNLQLHSVCVTLGKRHLAGFLLVSPTQDTHIYRIKKLRRRVHAWSEVNCAEATTLHHILMPLRMNTEIVTKIACTGDT